MTKRTTNQVTIEFDDLDETEKAWLRERGVIRDGVKFYSDERLISHSVVKNIRYSS